ncbi:dienelactone hydrolase family protein [Actinoplanes sp. HUAS TT8]|uniref:dienelactone hydrolase family protein n=1 Tax=Actinoplanes sp. HUAS TT8 TaxID=3447453 RepID=UPI003F5288EF
MKRRSLISIPAATLASGLADVTAARAAAGFENPAVIGDNLPVFYERLRDELDFPLSWPNSRERDFRTWKRRARAQVEELLWQPEDRSPFHVEVIDEQPGNGFRRRQLAFDVTRHSRVRATMLVPEGPGPFPAALLLHDHGARFDIGKEKVIEPWYDDVRLASARGWADKYFSGRFIGDQLAARGYAVLAVDALGWGDRGGLAYEGQQALASNLFNLGSSVAGLMAREDVRAAAMLAGLPEVDGRRVAAVGFSMGGFRAWQVAALSDHIAATVSACWMTGLKEMMVPGNNTLRGQSAFYMLHPGLFRHLDIPDVASIAAPRAMFVLDGELDPLFTAAGRDAAYTKMGLIWKAQHARERLRTQVWPGLGHVFVDRMQDAAFTWLDRWLHPTA